MRSLTEEEHRLLKRIADQGQVAVESMTSQDRKTFKSLVALGYVRPLPYQPGEPVDYTGKVLDKESQDESYSRNEPPEWLYKLAFWCVVAAIAISISAISIVIIAVAVMLPK